MCSTTSTAFIYDVIERGDGWARSRHRAGAADVGPHTVRRADENRERQFLAAQGERIRLTIRPAQVDPFYGSEEQFEHALASHVDRLGQLQQLLYAVNQYALLVILQGMDASGKDGAIRHVMSGSTRGAPGVQLQASKRDRIRARLRSGAKRSACLSGGKSASSIACTARKC